MRSASGDGDTVLPWHVIREDGHGNRYRVGSYATRTEAQQVADRLTANSGRAEGDRASRSSTGREGTGGGTGSYLVEALDSASGEYA